MSWWKFWKRRGGEQASAPVDSVEDTKPDRDAPVRGLSLYQTTFCPYCVRVRNAMEKLGLDIEIRDIQEHPERRREVIEATGRQTVPVLRIEDDGGEVTWMPESLSIIEYLRGRFSDTEQAVRSGATHSP